jgi:hypothetical protein
MARVEMRTATAADVDRFFGSRPAGTVKTVVVTVDGEPAAIGGLSYADKRVTLFSDLKPAVRPYVRSMAFLRAVKQLQTWCGQAKAPVFAVADDDEPTSKALLTRLGFECIADDVYVWGAN